MDHKYLVSLYKLLFVARFNIVNETNLHVVSKLKFIINEYWLVIGIHVESNQ